MGQDSQKRTNARLQQCQSLHISHLKTTMNARYQSSRRQAEARRDFECNRTRKAAGNFSPGSNTSIEPLSQLIEERLSLDRASSLDGKWNRPWEFV